MNSVALNVARPSNSHHKQNHNKKTLAKPQFADAKFCAHDYVCSGAKLCAHDRAFSGATFAAYDCAFLK